MIYVYLDNFRGFKDTFVPIETVNFLVGENSTGKSSLLSLIYLLLNPRFAFNCDFDVADCCDLGGFKDIISVYSNKKKYFSVGIHLVDSKDNNEKINFSFVLLTFKNNEGIPKLYRYARFFEKKLLTIVYQTKDIKYKTKKYELEYMDPSKSMDFIRSIIVDELISQRGLKVIPKKFPLSTPVSIIATLIETSTKMELDHTFEIQMKFPIRGDLTWFAPIRSKPRRTYDGFRMNFTPEGDHTPHILKKVFSSSEKGKVFLRKLNEFGSESGLFKSVMSHSFGSDPSSPFEVQVKLSEQAINISNVGYGVSQVLPLLVEMLTRPKWHWFAIQQPEVHLHPKAQAALGDLIYYLSKERNHRYLIETHSDYLIDRFRKNIKEDKDNINAQVLYFERLGGSNIVHPMEIKNNGRYPEEQPVGFREFFVKEELSLLEI